MNISLTTLANLLPFLAILSQSVDAATTIPAAGGSVVSNTNPLSTANTISSTNGPGTSALKDATVEKHLDTVPLNSSPLVTQTPPVAHVETGGTNLPVANVGTTGTTNLPVHTVTPSKEVIPTPPADEAAANKFYKDFYETQVKEGVVHPDAKLDPSVTGQDVLKKTKLIDSIKSFIPSFSKKKEASTSSVAEVPNTTGTTTSTITGDKVQPEGRIMPPTTSVAAPKATAFLEHHDIREGDVVATGMGSYYEKFSKLLEVERLKNLSLTNSGKKPADIELSKLPPAVRAFVIVNKIKHEIFEKVPCPTDDKDPLRALCNDEKKFTEELIEKVHVRFPFADDAYAAWIHTEPIPANGFLSSLFGHKKFLTRMENDQLQRIHSIFQERNNALSAWDNTVPQGAQKKSEKVADEIKDLSSSINQKISKLQEAIKSTTEKSAWKESTTCLKAGYEAFKAAVTEFQEEATKLKELNAFTEATPSSSVSKNGIAKK